LESIVSRHSRLPSLSTFAIIWFGQLVSRLGSGLTGFGLSIWLFERTGSATQFALNTAFYVLPLALCATLAGALVDRADRRWILIVADTGQALLTLGIAAGLALDQLAVWHIYLATTLSAVLQAFQGPAYEASVALLVPKEQLGRAAGMAQLSRAVSDLIAPVLAGYLILELGLTPVLLIDLATFAIALLTLAVVRIPSPQPAAPLRAGQPSIWRDLQDGWQYLRRSPGLLTLVLLSAADNFPRNAALILTVPMVRSVAGVDAVGLVLAAGGAGLLVGSSLMSAWGGPRRRVRGYLGFQAAQGVALMISGWSPHPLVIACGHGLFFLSFAGAVICLRPALQVLVAPEMQGRVFGLVGAIALLAEAPAYPLAGLLADRIFEPGLAADGALAGLLGAVLGTGPGRGMGTVRALMGGALVTLALIGALLPRLRRVDDQLQESEPSALAR
jgi:DHA3 family macrolide efflux protein-like MFS transporter